MAAKTEDRNVLVCVPLMASQIEDARGMSRALAEFPTIAWNYADRIHALLSGDASGEAVGQELAQLVHGLRIDAERAHVAALGLRPMVEAAKIVDPKGQEGERPQ
ncbi:hypothetical protein [Rhodovulum steppense]|uniref:Uncharacterized protein n=1 Tax=Rhodovulum steppense TaxID=540251 RepID=A0A4R1YKT0_9RHOB|nr:hypothetical protein [Rhodovulum steppense]TCM77622.1 hypothetical protein EV216_12949 [Rhodovulum steppense]